MKNIFNFENERIVFGILCLKNNALYKLVLILRFFNKIV
jgi:hypothetical protein